MEYCTAIKLNELQFHAATWMAPTNNTEWKKPGARKDLGSRYVEWVYFCSTGDILFLILGVGKWVCSVCKNSLGYTFIIFSLFCVHIYQYNFKNSMISLQKWILINYQQRNFLVHMTRLLYFLLYNLSKLTRTIYYNHLVIYTNIFTFS